MDRFLQDLRYAIRQLRRSRGFAAMAVLTLALGIGATTAIFSVVETVLLQPLPYHEPGRVAMIWSSWKDFPQTWVSYDEFEAYRSEVRAFDDVGLFTDYTVTFDGSGDPERVRVAGVTGNLFGILGVEPAMGRTFVPEEVLPGNDAVVILGHELWQRRFAGDPSIVGRTVEVNGALHRVAGIMPAGFRLPLDYGADGATEAWFPLVIEPEDVAAVPGPAFGPAGGNHNFYGVARLAPGATLEQANAQLQSLTSRLNDEGVYPTNWDFRATAVSVPDQVTGNVRPALWVLLGAVGLVLLVACANVAGLLLVRGEQRRREIGVRAALGAGRSRLVRQFLAESVVLALFGGALGLWLAWVATGLIRATAPISFPRISEINMDVRVLGFALVASIATAVVSGVVPAFHAAGVNPSLTLKDGGRGTTGSARARIRKALVVAEIAVAVVLVIGAGLMARSVRNLIAIDPGFSGEHALTMQVSTSSSHYPDAADVTAFYSELRRRLAEMPGVEAAGAARILPLATEIGDMGVSVPGYAAAPGEATSAEWQVVTPGFFEAMGTDLIAGRVIDERDHVDAALALVVNQSFAGKYFPGRNPLGRQVHIGGPDEPGWTVIGVVEDAKHNTLTGEVKPRFYAPHAQLPPGFVQRTMSLVVRSSGDATALIEPVRAQIRSMDPRLAVSDIRLMKDIVDETLAQPRFTMLLLAVFAALTLVLGAIGIYGVIAYSVGQRTREIGIRLALGAATGEVLGLVVRQGIVLALVGASLGIVAALGATRVLTSLLYGVSATDPLTYVAAPLFLAGVAILAAYLPARRATKVDPMITLRSE